MSGSLKEQLLKLGLGRAQNAEAGRGGRSARPPAPAPQPTPAPGGPAPRPGARPMREVEREREARRVRLRECVEAARLDDPQAEIRRHFSTGRKIKRVYVTEAQQAALLRGEIVIVVVDGKGRLIPAALVETVRAIDPEVLVIEPGAAQDGQPADEVPDDLRW